MQDDDYFAHLKAQNDEQVWSVGYLPLTESVVTRSYDWVNGIYLHVRDGSKLLPDILSCTYSCFPFFSKPISFATGEALCNTHEYKTGVHEAPQFPHMTHLAALYREDVEFDGVVAIPLVCNLFGSDKGHGIPMLAFVFDRFLIRCHWSPAVVAAIRNSDITLSIVANEYGYETWERRNDSVMHRHVKRSPLLNDGDEWSDASIELGEFQWL